MTAKPSDDLQGLVKAMFRLSHPQEAGDLHAVPQTEYARLLSVWEELFAAHPWWEELRSLAEADDYDAVATRLAGRFD